MRVAVGIHGDNVEKAIESYNLVRFEQSLDPFASSVTDNLSAYRCLSDTLHMLPLPCLQLVHPHLRCPLASWSP